MVQQLQHVFDILCILNDEIQFHVELATDQLKRAEKKIKMMNLNPNPNLHSICCSIYFQVGDASCGHIELECLLSLQNKQKHSLARVSTCCRCHSRKSYRRT